MVPRLHGKTGHRSAPCATNATSMHLSRWQAEQSELHTKISHATHTPQQTSSARAVCSLDLCNGCAHVLAAEDLPTQPLQCMP